MSVLRTSLVFALAASALPFGASAQIFNPDNDWRNYFKPSTGASTQVQAVAGGMPKLGDVSPDGQLVFLGDNRGWQPRGVVYELQGGQLVHAADCPLAVASNRTKANSSRSGAG